MGLGCRFLGYQSLHAKKCSGGKGKEHVLERGTILNCRVYRAEGQGFGVVDLPSLTGHRPVHE